MPLAMTEEGILKVLAHGSGINCDWVIEDKGRYFKCTNSYHCMNENGYYDGYADFSLIIDKALDENGFVNFRIHFHGPTSHYKNERYLVRDYLEDTFACNLNAFNDWERV